MISISKKDKKKTLPQKEDVVLPNTRRKIEDIRERMEWKKLWGD